MEKISSAMFLMEEGIEEIKVKDEEMTEEKKDLLIKVRNCVLAVLPFLLDTTAVVSSSQQYSSTPNNSPFPTPHRLKMENVIQNKKSDDTEKSLPSSLSSSSYSNVSSSDERMDDPKLKLIIEEGDTRSEEEGTSDVLTPLPVIQPADTFEAQPKVEVTEIKKSKEETPLKVEKSNLKRTLDETPKNLDLKVQQDYQQHHHQRSLSNKKSPDQIHVLIVDDDLTSCMLLAKQLKKLHYQATYAISGLDALSLLLKSPFMFDLVLCDVTMPGLDGSQLLKSILSMPQLAKHVPVVMISAADDAGIAQELVNSGAKDYLIKPIYTSTLASLVGKLKVWASNSADQASSKHLSALYRSTGAGALFMQIRVGIDIIDEDTIAGELLDSTSTYPMKNFIPSDSYENEHEKERNDSTNTTSNSSSTTTKSNVTVNHVAIRALTCVTVSAELMSFLGITNNEIQMGLVDMLSCVHPEDINLIRTQILNLVFQNTNGSQRIQWRWKNTKTSYLPVVGRFSSLGDGTLIVESKSLLPLLLLNEEKKLREFAEQKMISFEEKNKSMEILLRQERDTNKLASVEMDHLITQISDQARMVSDNPFILFWNIDPETYFVSYISPISCFNILGYQSNQLEGKHFALTLVSQENERNTASDPNSSNNDELSFDEMTSKLPEFSGQEKQICRKKLNNEKIWLHTRSFVSNHSIIVIEYE